MKIEYKKIGELILDRNNARFAELYSGSKKEDELIEYLLYEEAASEVAANIVSRKEFYPDQALWVISKGKKFLVRDGNRRCAAVKALHFPSKYGLRIPKMAIKKVPVLVYTNIKELERRIQEKHTNSFFREWERIAKALKVFQMHQGGFSEESLREIDSDPSQLIKLAGFYYKAVDIAGEGLRKLLRRGRGSSGGKAIIFERLFRYGGLCGYKFKIKPTYEMEILNEDQFKKYVNSMVKYLQKNPSTSSRYIDKKGYGFLKELKKYGFTPKKSIKKSKRKSSNIITKKGSIKEKPIFRRKLVPAKLKKIIDECYALDNEQFANTKVTLSRVVFETILKYVIKETRYKGKKINSYNYFHSAFYDKKSPRKYPNFKELRKKFIGLIKDGEIKSIFEQFDLEKLHATIHSYNYGAGPSDAKNVSENLLPLVEFMLDDVNDFLNSIEVTKLK